VVDPDRTRAFRHGGIFASVDTYLAIVSRREVKSYSQRAIPDEVVRRILNAGRLAGSGGNRQPWTFVVAESREAVEQLAETVFAPQNVLGAELVVGVIVGGKGPIAFDAGRAVQNMLLAAWNEGVGGSPNGFADPDRAAEVLGVHEGERPMMVLSFGYPERTRDPEQRPAEEWSRRAKRRPLEELVRRI
jgi:nitroreductase